MKNVLEKVDRKEIGLYLKDVIQKTISGNSTQVAADGGNAVGARLISEIFDQLDYKGVIWSKIRKIGVIRGSSVKMPSMVNTLANEPITGIRTYWTNEGDQSTASKIRYSGIEIELDKLTTRVPVTNELDMDNVNFADSFMEAATESLIYKIEREAFLAVGKSIKGIAGDGDFATVTVSTTTDIVESELKAYVDALHPMAYANAEWYVTPQQYSVITSINYTADNALTFENGNYYLFGFKVVLTPQLVGTPYHVVLGDFTKYAIGYFEPKFSNSIHVRFLEDEKEMVLHTRICGSTFAETSALDDGNTYGFFVLPSGGEAGASSSSSTSSSSSESEGNTSSSSESSESVGNNSSSSSVDSSSSSSSSSEEYSSSSSSS